MRRPSSSSRRHAPHAEARPPSRDGVSASCVALPSGPWNSVLDFLCERLPLVAREDWRQRMANAEVLDAHGAAVLPDAAFRPQSKLFYYRSLPSEDRIPFEASVLYRDEHLVVADKPHFLPVIPTGRYVQETLLVRLKRSLGLEELSPLHRIDRETAGLVVFGVKAGERDRYHALFRERAVQKHYEAVAAHRPDLAWPRTVRNRILTRGEAFMQMQVVEGEPNSETLVSLLEARAGLARYALQPLTGRRHQLRLHMASLGLPILGDRIYPVLQPETPRGERPDYGEPLRLLARRLAFCCPITGRDHVFESQLRLPM